MKYLLTTLFTGLIGGAWTCGLAADTAPTPKWHPGHYVFVGQGEIKPEHILEHFRGVEKCYTWTSMEPRSGGMISRPSAATLPS